MRNLISITFAKTEFSLFYSYYSLHITSLKSFPLKFLRFDFVFSSTYCLLNNLIIDHYFAFCVKYIFLLSLFLVLFHSFIPFLGIRWNLHTLYVHFMLFCWSCCIFKPANKFRKGRKNGFVMELKSCTIYRYRTFWCLCSQVKRYKPFTTKWIFLISTDAIEVY